MYAVVCRSVNAEAEKQREQRKSEEEETSSPTEAGLKKQLLERERCKLSGRLLSRDGPRCPPKRPLSVRRDALQALHAIGARRFTGVDLDEVTLPSADLRDSWFEYAQMRRANLREAQLYFADFGHATLEDTDFTRANLWSATFHEANLRRAKLKLKIDFRNGLVSVWRPRKAAEPWWRGLSRFLGSPECSRTFDLDWSPGQ
jgi:uncharacterized protein YjbI with pentapeptide repeats